VRWGSSFSEYFNITSGVRQGGVLSPVLFSVYVDRIIGNLQDSGYGCVIGAEYFGCVMYADDLVLISHSVCIMQKMVNMCIDELNCLGLTLNVKKSCFLRFGPRYMRPCAPIMMHANQIKFVDKAKYLGVFLCSGKRFGVDLQPAKSNFYSSFNNIFHRVSMCKNELVALHLISAYCKPYLIYGTECIDLNITQIRSIEHTWQTAISHIFHINGADVRSVCDYITDVPFSNMLLSRRLKFVSGLRDVNNSRLQYLFNVTAKHELLKVMRLDHSIPMTRLWDDVCRHCVLFT
jgi:Reverse transcriptase (RNA-dependent DNA polymerase)